MKLFNKTTMAAAVALAGFTLALPSQAFFEEVEEFDEFEPIVEINATDGDVGFHVLVDGEAWKHINIRNPQGRTVFRAHDSNSLRQQGLTELFMESAEPPCWDDDGEYDEDEIVTVEKFLERFVSGEYSAHGLTLENERLESSGELTHAIPAAPETMAHIIWDEEEAAYDVAITWGPGSDLGNCEFDAELLDEHPADVEVVRWEIVVEPDEDTIEEEGGEWPEDLPFSTFAVQVPGHINEVEVPDEFMQPYLDAGVYHFKYEVGAKEESGNQTFTEEAFTVGME